MGGCSPGYGNEQSRKFIRKDTKATIGSDGLMGNKIVLLVPGSATKEEIKNNDFIVTVAPVSINDIMLKLKITVGNAADITNDLSVIMSNISSGRGTVGKLFMDTTFAQNIDQAIINIKQGTGGFKQNMDAAGHSVLLRGYFKNKDKDKKK